MGVCHIIGKYPDFGEIYLKIDLRDGHLEDVTFLGHVIKKPTSQEVLQRTSELFMGEIKIIKAVRTSDINQENKVTVVPRLRPGGFFSLTKYEDVHEQLLPGYNKNRCPKCASQHLSFTQETSQTYNAGKGLVGNLVFGTVGALSGFESNTFERIHCMECGESWYASSTGCWCELRFDESFSVKHSVELLKKLYNNCLTEVARNESSNNYKRALAELAMAIYCRLHCQTLLSAKERFDDKNFHSICGEDVYTKLYLFLNATGLNSQYDVVKKAIVDASFIKNRAWAQKDLSNAIDKLFAAKEDVEAEIIDIKDTFFMFNCPYCGKVYKISTASKGAYIDCKSCHNSIEIK